MVIKRGDTLAFYLFFKDESGAGVVRDNVFCQLRTRSDVLIKELVITPTATVGKYLATAGDTTDYPIGTLFSDVEVRDGDVVTSSATFNISIVKGVTREEA